MVDPNLWLDAATQSFYSLSIGAGGIIAFSSYNPKNQNCMRDSIVINFLSMVTAFFVGAVIFSILGFKATQELYTCYDANIDIISDFYDIPQNKYTHDNYDRILIDYDTENLDLEYCDFDEIISSGISGSGLTFIVIAEAINQMPVPPLMSILFFSMILMLGLGSLLGNLESIMTPLLDLCDKLKWRVPKPALTLTLLLTGAATGFLFTQESGYYWVSLFNDYSASVPLLIVGLCEIFTCSILIGVDNWMGALQEMIGKPDNVVDKVLYTFFWIMIGYVSPLVLLAIFIGYIFTAFTGDFVYRTQLIL